MACMDTMILFFRPRSNPAQRDLADVQTAVVLLDFAIWVTFLALQSPSASLSHRVRIRRQYEGAQVFPSIHVRGVAGACSMSGIPTRHRHRS